MKMASSLRVMSFRRSLDASARMNEIFLFLFTFFAVITPYDNFHIKKISLLILLVANARSFFKKPQAMVVKLLYVFSLCFVPFSAIVSFGNGSSLISILSELFNVLYFLLIVIAINKQTNVRRYFNFSLKVLAVLIVLGFVLDFCGFLDIYQNPVLIWFRNSGNMMLGKSSSYFSNYILFFKTSPLIFYLLFDSIRKKKIVWSIFSFASILLTGTRANFFLAIVLLIVFVFFTSKDRFIRFLLVSIVLLVLLLFWQKIFGFVSRAFVLKESSDAVRDSDLNAILEGFEDRPFTLLLGSGIGSVFYSSGRSQFVTNIELSYWNMLRQFGIVGFLLFVGMFFVEFVHGLKRRDYLLIFFVLSFLVVAYTNPFLFGSTGALVLIMAAEGNHCENPFCKSKHREKEKWWRYGSNAKNHALPGKTIQSRSCIVR